MMLNTRILALSMLELDKRIKCFLPFVLDVRAPGPKSCGAPGKLTKRVVSYGRRNSIDLSLIGKADWNHLEFLRILSFRLSVNSSYAPSRAMGRWCYYLGTIN
jgi:hypothetical protein